MPRLGSGMHRIQVLTFLTLNVFYTFVAQILLFMQSDLGLRYLHMPFYQKLRVFTKNFRTFTVVHKINSYILETF